MAKKALGLIVGNASYPGYELINPVNDANDISSILRKLGFITVTKTECTLSQMDFEVDKFGDELNKYDIGLFFFAGHGLQIRGENYLAAVNTNFHDEISVQYSSTPLNKVLDVMYRNKDGTNIVILDACRDNPFEKAWNRSIKQRGLAPMYAPKGSIIAYATSPGETAADGTSGNGLYTSALLSHIETENIPIEELFKRVRNTVYAFSKGKQTTWEHTSLTGTFYFNSGDLASVIIPIYSDKVVADTRYKAMSNSPAERIIDDLRKYDWNYQNPAIDSIPRINPKEESKDTLFILGRNILQSACGGSFRAEAFVRNIKDNTIRFNIEGENHLLRGLLFEIYFDSEGKFRREKFKTCFLNEILEIQSDNKFKDPILFIQEQLKQFFNILFIVPSIPPQNISLDLFFDKNDDEEFIIKEILFEGKNVLQKKDDNSIFSSGDYYETILFQSLAGKISSLIATPINQIKINTNYDLTMDSKVQYPYGTVISKNS
jgi:hypothetical protein